MPRINQEALDQVAHAAGHRHYGMPFQDNRRSRSGCLCPAEGWLKGDICPQHDPVAYSLIRAKHRA